MDSLLYNNALNYLQNLKEEKLRLSQNLDTIESTIVEVHTIISTLKMKSDDYDVFSPRNRESLNRDKLTEAELRLNDLESQKNSVLISIEKNDSEILRYTEMIELEVEKQEDDLLLRKYISAYHQQTSSISKRMELMKTKEPVSREEYIKEVLDILKICNQVILQDPMAAKGYIDKAISNLDSNIYSNHEFLNVSLETNDTYLYAPCFDKSSFQKALSELPSYSKKVMDMNFSVLKHTSLFYTVIYNFLYDVFVKFVSKSVADRINFSFEENDNNLDIHLSYVDNLYPENYEFLYELDSIAEFVHSMSGSENIKWDNNIIKDIYFSFPVPKNI